MKTRFGAKDSLITNELVSVHQADLGKSHFDSVPKGQNMANAKYLRKRIALVAAAALGVGMLAAAPAFATTPAFVGTTVVTGTGATATGVVTGVTETFGSVTRASATTWTSSVSLGVTGTGFDANTSYVVTGTVAATTGTATSASGTLTGTFNSATSATLAGTLTFTAVSATYANVLAAADAYAMTLKVNVNATVVSASPVNSVTIPSTSAVSFLAGTAYSGSGNALTQIVGGIATFSITNGANDTQYTIVQTGVGSLSSHTETTTNAATNTNGTNLSGGLSWTPGNVANMSLALSSGVAGTSTVTFNPIGTNGVPGTAVTATVTWTALPTMSTQYTTAFIGSGTTAAVANGAVSLPLTAGVTTGQANIAVTVKDGSNANLNSQTVSVTVAGPGLVAITTLNGTGPGTARVASTTLGAINTAQININADGTAGVSTLTVSVGSTVIATKSVTFYGGVSKTVATQNFAYAKAGSTLGATPTGSLAATGALTDTPAVNVSFTDANGNAVAGVTTKMTSSNTAVIIAGTCTQVAATPGTYECSVVGAVGAVAGSTATVTFGGLAADGVTYVNSAPVTFTISKSTVAAVTMAWDAATYAPGSKAVLTITAKDALGNPVADHTDALFFTGALSSTIAVNGTLPGPSITFIGGKKTVTVYAPTVPGAFTVSGTIDGVNADATATGVVSATATVTGSTSGGLSAADAAAIAAAKAAAEAATAAVATLSTTVASLIASITAQIRALSAQIAKLFAKSGGSTPGLPKTGAKKK
jgi:hypothetical protein